MNFEGDVVLITGASSGIGADAARHLAKLGATVVIVGRNEHRLCSVAEEIEKSGAQKPLFVVADVTKDAKRIVNKIIKTFGRLDVLINIKVATDKNLSVRPSVIIFTDKKVVSVRP